jgi:hypothetical protein
LCHSRLTAILASLGFASGPPWRSATASCAALASLAPLVSYTRIVGATLVKRPPLAPLATPAFGSRIIANRRASAVAYMAVAALLQDVSRPHGQRQLRDNS